MSVIEADVQKGEKETKTPLASSEHKQFCYDCFVCRFGRVNGGDRYARETGSRHMSRKTDKMRPVRVLCLFTFVVESRCLYPAQRTCPFFCLLRSANRVRST